MPKFKCSIEEIKNLISKNYNIKELAEYYNVNRNTLSRFLKSNDLSVNKRVNCSWTDEDLIKAVKITDTSITRVIDALGLATSGSTYNLVYRRIKELKLDTSHMGGKRYSPNNLSNYADDEIFMKDSLLKTTSIKKAILDRGLIDYKCSICKSDDIWLDNELVLQLDHINGISNDHRINNLRFLCPNCHSQTKTWGGRNNRGKLSFEEVKLKKVSNGECYVCKDPLYTNSKYCSKECQSKTPDTFKITNNILSVINSTTMKAASVNLGISDTGLKKALLRNGYKKIDKLWSKC